ncbi:PEP-CTERM sorting domain-containing protein [filamentous cyanobacterium LEGE 11480]|uniref:PEP-CTERM sorting domain-containing protein n=2 Tax=Romeriopsis TaxID=2992131 RepID=A0A928Z467_9CYAN|nr:PEP-CTERM sorting domain-containing protein [Romeriopsis navalis LEGE 11480]
MKFVSKVVCSLVIGTVAVAATAGSADAFSFKVTSGIADIDGSTDRGAFSDFHGQDGFFNINFDDGIAPTSGPVQYSFQNGNTSSVRNNVWAPTSLTGERNKTDYLAVFNGDSVNIDLDEQFNYYGIAWGAISDNNTFSFYNGSELVKTITTQDIDPVAPVRASHQNGEGNGYVHFYADNANETFNRIVISQISSVGGGFETDNHSFRRGSGGFDYENPTKTPEPAAMLGLAVAGGAAWLKRKRAAKA